MAQYVQDMSLKFAKFEKRTQQQKNEFHKNLTQAHIYKTINEEDITQNHIVPATKRNLSWEDAKKQAFCVRYSTDAPVYHYKPQEIFGNTYCTIHAINYALGQEQFHSIGEYLNLMVTARKLCSQKVEELDKRMSSD